MRKWKINSEPVELTPELVDVFNRCFRYNQETGQLFWNPRPKSDFKSQQSFSCWHTRFCGKEAGTYHAPNGSPMMVRPISTDEEIDHRDCNPFNNRLENLRIAGRNSNNWNVGKKRRNGKFNGLPKGVRKVNRRFGASIMEYRKRHWLGYFDTAEEAGAAYESAARRLHGEFARL